MLMKYLEENNMFQRKMKITPQNVLKIIRSKRLITRYTILTVSLFISAILFNLFLLPSKIVSGGTSGISIITTHLFEWSPSVVVLIISIVLLVISFFFLGKEETAGALVATFVYPLFIDMTASVGDYVKIDMNDLVLISIVVGLIGGLTSGLIYKTGFNSGGLNIVSKVLFKYFKISISQSTFIMNTIIVVIGGFYFGWTQVMYAIIILYINSLMIDKVLLGISRNKAFYIITDKENEVKEYVMTKLNHGVTVFDVKGGFLAKKQKVLLIVIPTKEYFQVTEGIKLIDKDVFFVVTDAYQVSGGA